MKATLSRVLWLCLLGAMTPAPVLAASVFLNGVNIDGVRNQDFKNATVHIDEHGNVHITAKGYAVQGKQAPPPAPAPADEKATERFWLVTEKAAPGMAQYDIELFVNGKWIRKFLDEEEQVVLELTKYLKKGNNQLTFLAKKKAGARRSSSPQHYFRIVVGKGDSGGRNVMITKKFIDYKRTALETKDFKDDFNIVAQ